MIKECNVILQNEYVAVVDYNGKKIQIPNTDLIRQTAYIKLENEIYTVVSKEEYMKFQKDKRISKRRSTIKTDDKNRVIDNEE